jgi:hypothetical protein
MLLPATSEVTSSANFSASSRQTRAAAVSKPDGAGDRGGVEHGQKG